MSTTTTTATTIETLHLQSPKSEADKVIYGKLRYIPAGHVPAASPHNFHLPPISEFGDVRRLPLNDMRPVPTVSQLHDPATMRKSPNTAQLSAHGFTAVHHPTTLNSSSFTLSNWKDPALLARYYIPDTEAMVAAITGAKTVITETLILRSAVWSESDALATHAGHGDQAVADDTVGSESKTDISDPERGFPQFIGFNLAAGGASPAPKVHLDYAPEGARTHLRKFHPLLREKARGVVEAEDKLMEEGKTVSKDYHNSGEKHPRWALYSIWRPLKRVRRDPLALGDRRTFLDDDYVPVNVKTPCLGLDNDGPANEPKTHLAASYLARYSEGQQWYWISDQTPEEVLVIGLFDSSRERNDPVAAGGTLHSSVDIEGTEDEEARESIELRCLAIW